MDYSEIITTLIGVIVGGILGALLSYFVSKRVSKENFRNNLTNEILKYFNSQEFLYVLQVLQIIKNKEWNSKKGKLLVNYFIPIADLKRPNEDLMKNELTLHQNLTLYFRFISQVHWYLKDNAVNKELIEKIIIREHYRWHKPFFTEFIDEFEKVSRNKNFDPDDIAWYVAIREFNKKLNE